MIAKFFFNLDAKLGLLIELRDVFLSIHGF